MIPHPHTTALCGIVDRSRLPDHIAARLKWIAWIHWSSRSGANFFHLLLG